jgi:hypothetical protein
MCPPTERHYNFPNDLCIKSRICQFEKLDRGVEVLQRMPLRIWSTFSSAKELLRQPWDRSGLAQGRVASIQSWLSQTSSSLRSDGERNRHFRGHARWICDSVPFSALQRHPEPGGPLTITVASREEEMRNFRNNIIDTHCMWRLVFFPDITLPRAANDAGCFEQRLQKSQFLTLNRLKRLSWKSNLQRLGPLNSRFI